MWKHNTADDTTYEKHITDTWDKVSLLQEWKGMKKSGVCDGVLRADLIYFYLVVMLRIDGAISDDVFVWAGKFRYQE